MLDSLNAFNATESLGISVRSDSHERSGSHEKTGKFKPVFFILRLWKVKSHFCEVTEGWRLNNARIEHDPKYKIRAIKESEIVCDHIFLFIAPPSGLIATVRPFLFREPEY